MRVLVYPHMMEIGGSQLNAIELARETVAHGHEVILFGPDGELVPLARSWGLEYQISPEPRWPSPRNIRAVNRLVATRGIDLVHGYEWGPAVELAYGPHLRHRIPVVVTVMSMSVPDHIPQHLPLLVGTRDLFEGQRGRRPSVSVMEPPVDTDANSVHAVRPGRESWGIDDAQIVVGVVCRMVDEHDKAAGVLAAIAGIDALADVYPLTLLVTGDGDRLAEVTTAAETVNARHGRNVVIVTGALSDPRPVYATSDIIFGMGSSAIKGLSFGKPLIVQGQHGFWQLLDSSTLPMFLTQGWFGSEGRGVLDFTAALLPLLQSESLRRELGEFGRTVAVDRFSLSRAGAQLETVYRDAIDVRSSVTSQSISLSRAAVELAKFGIVISRYNRSRRTNPHVSEHRALPETQMEAVE